MSAFVSSQIMKTYCRKFSLFLGRAENRKPFGRFYCMMYDFSLDEFAKLTVVSAYSVFLFYEPLCLCIFSHTILAY